MTKPLFLIGFMAAGKTSVGRALAAATGRRFVDLDDAIAAKGEPVAQFVARDEAMFRRVEAETLREIDAQIIATGGGAAAYGDNLAWMRAHGVVIALGVDLTEVRRRAAGGPERPLLANAEALARAREAIYRRAHAVVDTNGKSIAEVVGEVAIVEAIARSTENATIVSLGGNSYPVVVTERLAALAGTARLAATFSRVAIVTDTNVARHQLSTVLELFAGLPPPDVIEIPPGEASKSFERYGAICERLVALGFDRGSLIIALGGGVVGDLAGFVAATFMRGIPILQWPTTLVAMVDAAIGGKTAIDLPAGKNLVGAFHQPRSVHCALEALDTLPLAERRAGFGELWKYALLDGPELWQLVDACASWSAGTTEMPAALGEVIARSIAYKAAIVGRDERERTGHRAVLNLGHTVGHAIESATGMLHGEAVGLGLLAACRVSRALGHPDLERQVADALRRSGLPADIDTYLTDEILARLSVDKKRIGANLSFIAIREVGGCEPTAIAVTELRRILRSGPLA